MSNFFRVQDNSILYDFSIYIFSVVLVTILQTVSSIKYQRSGIVKDISGPIMGYSHRWQIFCAGECLFQCLIYLISMDAVDSLTKIAYLDYFCYEFYCFYPYLICQNALTLLLSSSHSIL